MFSWIFSKKQKTCLGIDLGSSSLKIVELGWKDERAFLVNYGLLQAKSGATFSLLDLRDEEVIELLASLIKETKVSGHRVNVSLPVEKTFSTVINLPSIPENELAAAVSFEAQKYVPVPLGDVMLDWTIISGSPEPKSGGESSGVASGSAIPSVPQVPVAPSPGEAVLTGGRASLINPAQSAGMQILLLAVPKETINRVINLVTRAGLTVAALEQEAFSLARALIGNDKNTFIIIDIGRRGTDIIVLDQGAIKLSHSLESINKEVILMEIDRIVNIFQMRYNRRVGQCLLAGGRAKDKELLDFLSSKLKISVKVGDPFARVGSEAKIQPALRDLGPQFSVAVGLAMREE